MSMNGDTQVKSINMTVLAICLTAIICALIGAVILVFLAAPAERDPMPLVSLLFLNVAALLPVVGGILLTRSVKSDTQKMLNGTMDEKIRHNVRAVLEERSL